MPMSTQKANKKLGPLGKSMVAHTNRSKWMSPNEQPSQTFSVINMLHFLNLVRLDISHKMSYTVRLPLFYMIHHTQACCHSHLQKNTWPLDPEHQVWATAQVYLWQPQTIINSHSFLFMANSDYYKFSFLSSFLITIY